MEKRIIKESIIREVIIRVELGLIQAQAKRTMAETVIVKIMEVLGNIESTGGAGKRAPDGYFYTLMGRNSMCLRMLILNLGTQKNIIQ